MKSEDLLKYIGNVDDRFVAELMEEDKVIPMAKHRSNRRPWLTVAACLAVIILCASVMMGIGVNVDRSQVSLTGNVTNIAMAQNAVVMIDVNPSIQMEVNDRNIVVKAEALNDDAAALMEELQLEEQPYTDAVKDVISVLQENKYITNLKNSVLISVVDADEAEAESIRSAIIETIETLDENTDYDFSILSQVFADVCDYAELAEEYHMSAGRAAMIQKTCELYEGYDFDSLAECSIQTINQLFEYIPVPDFVQRIGKAAATVPDDFKETLGLEELSADEIISFTCAISDFYDRLCEYYDESSVANHIGYVFDIVCGENDNGTKLWAVLAENLSNKLNSRCAIINIGEKVISDWYSNSKLKEVMEYIENQS